MARRTLAGWAGIVATLMVSGIGRANPEPMSIYDGRSMAMGGTGVADNDTMAAVVLNPANFDLVKKFTATLDYAAISPKFTAPVVNPTSMMPEVTTNDTNVTSLGMAGAAYRIFDPLVVGLAAYINEGSGAAYSESYKFTFGEIEVALPISFRILEGLSIGVEPRFGYTMADVTLPPDPSRPFPLSGTLTGSTWGVTAGINWRPIDSLKLGLAWRSSMSFTLKGDANVGMGLPPLKDSSTNFAIPNTIRLGASWAVLKDLTLTPEVRWSGFAASNGTQVVTLGFPQPLGPQTSQRPQDWKNAWTGALGAEYRLLGILALRAGASVGNSATNPNTATPFDVPPGTIVSVGGGAGVQVIDMLSLDLGVFDQWGSATITNSPYDAPGKYSLNALFFGLSATLRI